MERGLQFRCRALSAGNLTQSGNTLQETLTALYGAVTPRCGRAVIAHEQDIRTQNELFHNVQRIYDVSLGFAHLVPIRSEDQTLSGTLRIRLFRVHHSHIVQEMVPETGIDHMACYVLHASVVPVNRHPVF